MPATRLTYLLNRHFEDKNSEEENDELMALLANPDNEDEVLTVMDHTWEDYPADKSVFTSEKSDTILSGIVKIKTQSPRRNKIIHRNWMYAVAAVALIFITITVVTFRNNRPVNEINQVVEIPKTIIKKKPLYKNDIKPGGNQAILTLADGTKIVLDKAAEGALARQGNTTVIKLDDGRLAYNMQTVSQIPTTKILYNTLSTPRGGQYRVTLPDGTLVWLNASTSLKFPTAFTGNERKVEIKGEAYFEVAKNEAMPFIVTAENSEIKVLGTHFNVSAYADDKVMKTTLLEGSVELSIAKRAGSETVPATIKLQPGQQAQLDETNILKVVEADTEEATAWKNGFFIFNNEDVESIMRKITRWYDVKVIYENKDENMRFTGNISRAENVSEVLRVLELTEIVHFKIEGKTITVLP
jgi:ferric-dicitrate binding protein FerR (iron transport regulator)